MRGKPHQPKRLAGAKEIMETGRLVLEGLLSVLMTLRIFFDLRNAVWYIAAHLVPV
jgi:hypothetical protein